MRIKRLKRLTPLLLAGVGIMLTPGCRTSQEWRKEADEHAEMRISDAQKAVTGKTEHIAVESAADTFRRRLLLDQKLPIAAKASLGIRDLEDNEHWKGKNHLREGEAYNSPFDTTQTVSLSLADAIIIAARNSREYQSQKDSLFQAALALDLENHDFETTFNGMLRSTFDSSHDGNTRNNGIANNGKAGVARTFKNGAQLMANLSVDLVKLLTGEKGSSWGVTADASISIPLLRGSGEFIVTEPLKQAERNLVYQIRSFEQYKRTFIVSIATSYLNVLQAKQKISNQEANYKRVVTSTRRSRRMADAGLLPENQFDQAVQDELTARDNWVAACQSYDTNLDAFRILIGLPPDANVQPIEDELTKLQKDGEKLGGDGNVTDYTDGKTPPADAPVELKAPGNEDAGPYEINEEKAIEIALRERPDLKNALDKIWDAQRAAIIAEDALRAELTIGGNASMGESRSLGQANMPDGSFRATRGHFSAPITFDLPWERTRERNQYRNSLIVLERSVREFQSEEDKIKQSIRRELRSMLENRSRVVIQRQAVKLAERRVDSTGLLLQAGRAAMRDVLEAQSALLSAQNSLISALVSYRLNELEIQRDLGVLGVTIDGIWTEAELK